MVDLPFEELAGHLGLREVVDAGGTAAPRCLGKFDELEAGDLAEDLAGLAGDLLAVAEVARIVVGSAGRLRARSRGQALLGEELGDVAALRGERSPFRCVEQRLLARGMV